MFGWLQSQAACHCFGSQGLNVAPPQPFLSHTCCGIRASRWGLGCSISVMLDIATLEKAMSPPVQLLDSGRGRLCFAKVLLVLSGGFRCYLVFQADCRVSLLDKQHH